MQIKAGALGVLVAAAASVPMTWAAVKCPGPNGKVIYQDTPCEGGRAVNLSGAGKGDPDSDAAQSWKSEIARQKRAEIIQEHIAYRRVVVGMTAEEAQRAWGMPTKVNTSMGSYSRHEQWVYERTFPKSDYVYVQNGKVTGVQISE